MGGRDTPAKPLRWHLVQVLLFGILPIGLLAAALLYFHWRAQDAERARIQMETTRLLAAAVDNEIDASIKRLAILGRLFSVRSDDPRELYVHASSAVEASPDWVLILAADGGGRGLFRTDVPYGTHIPPIAERSYFQDALRERRPVVSSLFVSPVSGQKVVGIALPWMEGERVRHVLAASLDLRWLDGLLTRQGLPPGGISGIFDQEMKFVARSHDGDARRGSMPAPGLHEDMKARPEGIGRYASLDDTFVYTSWARTRHGWWVALAAPAAPIDGAFWRYLLALGALWAGLIAAGIAFAAWKGRRIAASLALLEERASKLGRGDALPPPPWSDVAEIRQALAAVDRAGGVLEGARRERDVLLAAEQRARAAAERASRAKDEFIAMLGHELRNPLAAVSNAATVISAPQRSQRDVERAAGIIQRQSRHLKRLIDDLLDVGRVITGKIRLERSAVDLEATVRQLLATLQDAGTLARHRLTVHSEPVWVLGDPTRLEQILTNLLVNATTYTPPGGAIRVRLTRDRNDAVLEVSDEGIGIPAEKQPHVFELFYQGEAAGSRVQGGLGIGLTLVKRLVELHGGSVAVASEGAGRGATFTVRLPAVAAQQPATALAAVGARPRTVLIVEDNADARESLRIALEQRGHRVLHAADAASALAEVRAGRPNVALIDIGLPGTDGYELARTLRAQYGGQIALFALTGYGTPEDVRRAHDAGFERHLTKPVEVNELAALVSRAVS